MDGTIIAIFAGFVFAGFLIGYPLGAVMERRQNRANFFDGYKAAETVAADETRSLKVRREDSILNAEILEETRHAG